MSNERELPNGMKLVFAPGCFDNFEGTQEELDALVKEIEETFANGEALENATPMDMDEYLEDLLEDMSPEEIEALISEFESTPRTLQ